jgi:hypothetical protein
MFYEASTSLLKPERISHTRDDYVQSIRPNGGQDRKYVVQAAKRETAPSILCIGTAGTGVELRIRGHTKRGGTKMRQRHRRYTIVSTTNEYRSSQTCVFCFQQVQRPKTRKLVKGNGSLFPSMDYRFA